MLKDPMIAFGANLVPPGPFQFPDYFSNLERHTDQNKRNGDSVVRNLFPS
jgi:hypothetical protein